MNPSLNSKLLDKIADQIPSKPEQVQMLTNTLSLGKEAAVRRLRGEVVFTFEEACKIAVKLGCSLDDISSTITKGDKAVLIQELLPSGYEDRNASLYIEQILTSHEEFATMQNDPELYTLSSFDTLPISLLFPYPTLFRLHCFKWTYTMYEGQSKLADILISPDQEERCRMLSTKILARNSQVFIFDRRMYSNLANEILHFSELKLVSPDERIQLKEEMIASLTMLEEIAALGKSNDKREQLVWMFLSDLDLKGNYTYVKGNGFEFAKTQLYQLSTAYSTDSRLCRMQRLWIESFQKYSTLISIGGEKERKEFFSEQREYIGNLL